MAKLIGEAQEINGRMDKLFGQNPSLWPWDLWCTMARIWLAAQSGDADRFRDAVDGLVDSLSSTDAAVVFGS